jgi:MGT family glycosyltransferase
MVLRPMLGPDATVYPTGSRVLREQDEHGFAALKSLWERFIVPFTRFSLPAVDKAVQAFGPDVVLADQHSPAGALVAVRHRLPWATLVCSAMDITRPLRRHPKVDAWTEAQLAKLWAHAGLPADELVDVRFSPHLVLAFTGTALTGPHPFPEHFALVGPILAERPADPDFPWEWLDPRRQHVVVTVGTLAGDLAGDFYARAAAALGPLGHRLQAILVTDPAAVPDPPANVLVRHRVPLLELLPRLDAVVSHGGMNTVCESLANGVPLVVAPIRHDQPVNAAQVVAAGAGVRVPFARVGPRRLRDAVLEVVDEPGYRLAAAAIRDSFAAAGGARAAADKIEPLAVSVPPNRPLSSGVLPL